MWSVSHKADSGGALLADRHYPRRLYAPEKIGCPQFMPPGQTLVLVAEGAVWGVVFNVFRGVWRWRNSIFRNESRDRSSDLIASATERTYDEWARAYGRLPVQDLTTEVDIEATRARRSKRNPPGYCYRCAGWRELERLPAAHGRPARVRLAAPVRDHVQLALRLVEAA